VVAAKGEFSEELVDRMNEGTTCVGDASWGVRFSPLDSVKHNQKKGCSKSACEIASVMVRNSWWRVLV